MTSTWLIAVPATVLAAGVVLLAYALRGRRLDDHPLCRRCGFDLFGKPEGSSGCAECGADLARRRAVRTGRRACRRRPLVAAVALFVPCAGWFGLLGWGTARGVDWQRHKPAWWLTRDAEGTGPTAVRDAALAELGRRVAAGELPPDRAADLVARALDRQADDARPWAAGWGAIVEAARDAGRVTDDQWERYLRQGLPYRFQARPAVARDNELPMRLTRGPARLGTPGRFRLVQRIVDHEPAADPFKNQIGPALAPRNDLRVWVPVDEPSWPSDQPADGDRTYLIFLQPHALAGLGDGPQTVRLTIGATLIDTQAQPAATVMASPPAAMGNRPAGPPIQFELAAPFRLEPAGTVTGRPVTGPALRDRVRAALTADPIRLEFEPAGPTRRPGATAWVSVTARTPPIGLGVGTVMRAGGEEWLAMGGTFAAGVTQSAGIGAPGGGPAAANVDKVDVVLRPDLWHAERLVELDYWGEEVVLKDVPVRRQPAGTAGTAGTAGVGAGPPVSSPPR